MAGTLRRRLSYARVALADGGGLLVEGDPVALFGTKCPVDVREQNWIEESMNWFHAEFGEGPLRQALVLPTPDFFPDQYSGTGSEIGAVVARVCRHASVDPDMIMVEFYGDSGEAELARVAGLTVRTESTAGHYREEGGRAIIGIDETLAATPTRLVATIAHELGHVRLLGEGRITTDRRDHEALTDLLTVYLGFGIFTANACFDFSQDEGRRSTSRLGYLTEPMFGYGLACYAWLRGETRPNWAKYLDTNPRVYLKRGLRYLTDNVDTGQFPTCGV
jgi:hypothetical protein